MYIERLRIEACEDFGKAFKIAKDLYDRRITALKEQASNAGQKISNAFDFCEDVFADGQEILIFVTELTANYYCAKFISHYGCDKYFKHNKELLFYERRKEIIQELELLDLEE